MVPLWCHVGAILGHSRKKYREIEREIAREREERDIGKRKRERERETKREREKER